MTERIFAQEQFSALPEHGAAAQKIRALFMAYGGGYDFCRFFRQGDSFLAALDGSFVICAQPGADLHELAQFLAVHGFTDFFCNERTGDILAPMLGVKSEVVNLMERMGGGSGELPPEQPPSEVFQVIGSRFEVPFEPWYLDMSHRVRHGISRCFSDGRAALVVQHEINGEALISQVSVLKEYEGQGYAGALVSQVCEGLSSRVQVLCEDRLRGFYERCGFSLSPEKYITASR